MSTRVNDNRETLARTGVRKTFQYGTALFLFAAMGLTVNGFLISPDHPAARKL
jgi:hypothetical protein